MEKASAILPWVCCAIFVVIVIVLPLRARGPERMRDLQLSLNATPRLNVLGALYLLGGALVAILLGAVFLGAGYLWAWAFFPLAAGNLYVIGFFAYVARRPWPSFYVAETVAGPEDDSGQP